MQRARFDYLIIGNAQKVTQFRADFTPLLLGASLLPVLDALPHNLRRLAVIRQVHRSIISPGHPTSVMDFRFVFQNMYCTTRRNIGAALCT